MVFGSADDADRCGTIAFNVLDASGGIVPFREVERRAARRLISLRTGCFCNPGASEAARGVTADEMARAFALGRPPSIGDLAAIMPGNALGAVRVSVGIATIEHDLDRLVDLLLEFAE